MPDFLIWWTHDDEARQLGELPGTAPEYLVHQFDSRQGRAGHGRLWISKEFQQHTDAIESGVEWLFRSSLGRYLETCGGIVIRPGDHEHVLPFGGLLTALRPLQGKRLN